MFHRAVAHITDPVSSLPTSSSAHCNLASAPMQITVTTFSNAPSNLQTAKSKALSLYSICVDDSNCTSFLTSLLGSQTVETIYKDYHQPPNQVSPPAFPIRWHHYLTSHQSEAPRSNPQQIPLPFIQPKVLLLALPPKCLQISSPVHAYTTAIV